VVSSVANVRSTYTSVKTQISKSFDEQQPLLNIDARPSSARYIAITMLKAAACHPPLTSSRMGKGTRKSSCTERRIVKGGKRSLAQYMASGLARPPKCKFAVRFGDYTGHSSLLMPSSL
jgi:hypothetical protein